MGGENLEVYGPRRVQGDMESSTVVAARHDSSHSIVILRWDNSHAMLTSKALKYYVQVEHPPRPRGTTGVQRKEDRFAATISCPFGHLWMLTAAVCLVLSVHLAGLGHPVITGDS